MSCVDAGQSPMWKNSSAPLSERLAWTHDYNDGFLLLAFICESCTIRSPDAEKEGGPVSCRDGGLCICCQGGNSCSLQPQMLIEKAKMSYECCNCDYKGEPNQPQLCTDRSSATRRTASARLACA